jgi:hypothetical protein
MAIDLMIGGAGGAFPVLLRSFKRVEAEKKISSFVQKELDKKPSEIDLQDWLHKPREEIVFAISEIFKNALPKLLEGQFRFLDKVIKYHNISGADVKRTLYNGGMNYLGPA